VTYRMVPSQVIFSDLGEVGGRLFFETFVSIRHGFVHP